MTTKETELNVVSDDEDRGPLVEESELAAAKDSVENKLNGIGDSSEDVLAFLESDDDEEEDEIYADKRVPIARDIRPMIAAWHEYKNAMAQVKTSYKLWKIISQENLCIRSVHRYLVQDYVHSRIFFLRSDGEYDDR